MIPCTIRYASRCEWCGLKSKAKTREWDFD
jgi:hypothetical protein